MRLPKNQRKPNGHAGEDDHPGGTGGHQRVNGHALASTERGGIPVQGDQAASDDTRRAPVAMDASSIIAPGTDCGEYAEVAPLRSNGHPHDLASKAFKRRGENEPIPGGEFPLHENPGDFVEEIHRRADLFVVWQELLNSKDKKIKQRAVEKLTEMRYKGSQRGVLALRNSRARASPLWLRSFGPPKGGPQDDNASAVSTRIVTYREFVQNGLSPRMLAQAIAERSGRERISEIFLSPDAFAHRTSESSIAEQLGDVLVVNGLPRPAPADDDRIGGWQLMYQMMESNVWVITENCAKLIECIPQLVRDERRREDIRKVEGDDPADAARYGLVSGGRLAGVGPAFVPSRAGQAPPFNPPGSAPHFVTGMPLGEQITRQVTATDQTSRAIHYQRLESEAKKSFRPKPLPRRRW